VKFKEIIMRHKIGFTGKLIGAGALAALLATAAVAAPAPRHGGQWDSGRDQQQYDNNRGDRGQGNYGYGQRQSNYGYGYQRQGVLRGVVSRINYRTGMLTVRDQATGRFVNIDMQRMSGRGLRGLRRGDFVTVSGQWEGGNSFAAYRIN
jgi:hypothetical protein